MLNVYATAAKRTAKFFLSVIAVATVVVLIMLGINYVTGVDPRWVYDALVLVWLGAMVYWWNLDDAKKELTDR